MNPEQSQFVPVLRPIGTGAGNRLAARSINAQVAHALGIAIVSGQIAADQKLPPEGELLERYGISRTVLREALKILGAKGLIAARTNVGTWVLDRSHWQLFDADVLAWHAEQGGPGLGIDRDLLRDIFEFRLAIEPAAAALVARRAAPADLAALRDAIAAMRSAACDARAFGAADLLLHATLGRISGNMLMRGAANVVETSLMAVYAALAGRDESPAPADSASLLALHEELVAAIVEGDSVAAADAMTRVVAFESATVFGA